MNKYIIIALGILLSHKLGAQQNDTDTIVSLNSSSHVETPAIPLAAITIATALPDTTTIGYVGQTD